MEKESKPENKRNNVLCTIKAVGRNPDFTLKKGAYSKRKPEHFKTEH